MMRSKRSPSLNYNRGATRLGTRPANQRMALEQLASICIVVILLICGCDLDGPSESSTCQVTGKITHDGQAVEGAKLVFVPQRIKEVGQNPSRIASAISDDGGEFVLKVDARDSKQIHHDRYRVIASKVVDGKELFHESYNTESVFVVEIDSHEAFQRLKLEFLTSGTY